MNPEIEKTIYSYIILPYALKIFKRDRKQFENFSSSAAYPVYLDKLDTVIDSVQQDLNSIKLEIIKKYHLRVKYIGKENEMVQYKWYSKSDSGVIWIAADDLRNLTKDMMSDYLYGSLAVEVTPSGRPWAMH
ncbi:hypothetical protein [Sediminibacillus massiliensis]|uniref:hypothetical protein n=1 Tax=Sediminibacillus massiliensis TaxID=1926277 RepID=UPI0009888621|nr:hypothetical protein [Sediminibacillus massiliensis]